MQPAAIRVERALGLGHGNRSMFSHEDQYRLMGAEQFYRLLSLQRSKRRKAGEPSQYLVMALDCRESESRQSSRIYPGEGMIKCKVRCELHQVRSMLSMRPGCRHAGRQSQPFLSCVWSKTHMMHETSRSTADLITDSVPGLKCHARVAAIDGTVNPARLRRELSFLSFVPCRIRPTCLPRPSIIPITLYSA